MCKFVPDARDMSWKIYIAVRSWQLTEVSRNLQKARSASVRRELRGYILCNCLARKAMYPGHIVFQNTFFKSMALQNRKILTKWLIKSTKIHLIILK